MNLLQIVVGLVALTGLTFGLYFNENDVTTFAIVLSLLLIASLSPWFRRKMKQLETLPEFDPSVESYTDNYLRQNPNDQSIVKTLHGMVHPEEPFDSREGCRELTHEEHMYYIRYGLKLVKD